MTQAQACRKYGIPRDQMSRMVRESGIRPVGTVISGRQQSLNDYEESDLVAAIVGHYRKRYLTEVSRADRWKERATRIKTIFRKSQPPDDTFED